VQQFVASAAALSLAFAGEPGILTCSPAGYAQVQDDGVEYDRVDCVASRENNTQCGAQSYVLSSLQASPKHYTAAGQIPKQGEYLGRFELSIDRATGNYKFVVIGTTDNDPSWRSVKTFWGSCENLAKQLPL